MAATVVDRELADARTALETMRGLLEDACDFIDSADFLDLDWNTILPLDDEGDVQMSVAGELVLRIRNVLEEVVLPANDHVEFRDPRGEPVVIIAGEWL